MKNSKFILTVLSVLFFQINTLFSQSSMFDQLENGDESSSFELPKYDQGGLMIRGASNLNLDFSEGTPIDVSVSGGYFLKDRIMLGTDATLSHFDGSFDLVLEPFARWYLSDKFFAGPSILLGEDGYFSAMGGYVYQLNEKITLEPILKWPFKEGSKINGSIGISIYFDSL